MQRRLPPLTSLRAFEAAARRLSFTAAAEELGVTQAAISHQVKALEKHLGVALFVRLPRRLELTEPGAVLLPVLQSSLDAISRTVETLRQADELSTLCIAVAPSFAANWLLPRLDDLLRQHPQIELSLKHSNVAVDFTQQAIDLAVTYGKGNWPGVVSKKVLEIDFFPVCAPTFMTGKHALLNASNLRHCTLLHDADHKTWRDWLSLAGVGDVDPTRGTVMDDTNVLIQAAVDGIGVAMGSTSFVRDHLAAGRLVRPFDTTLRSDYAYYAVCPREHLERAKVRVFWDWLLEQAESHVRSSVNVAI